MTRLADSILLGTDAGVLQYRDGAVTPLSSDQEQVTALARLGDSELVAGTAGGGLFRSQRGTTEWARVSNDLDGSIESLCVTTPKRVLAGTSAGTAWRSDDRGETYHALELPGMHAEVDHPLSFQRIARLPLHFVACAAQGKLWKTIDGGSRFETCKPGIPGPFHGVAVHPRDPDTWVLLLPGSIARSSAAGNSFHKTGRWPDGMQPAVAWFAPQSPHALWVLAQPSARPTADSSTLWTSTDLGDTFQQVNPRLVDHARDPTGEITCMTARSHIQGFQVLLGTDRGELLVLEHSKTASQQIVSGLPPIRTILMTPAISGDPSTSGIHLLP